MLDKDTKDKIDDLRQILVGKVTDPRSQVEQITNALLYKFMNDMDENSQSLGGIASYFINEYEKYSWKNLLNKKTTGEEKVELYSKALEQMFYNKNLPQIFREIFKYSTLPYKDPRVFNKFINIINDFNYSDSETLGDAFEYLLSFMGKQGDAGQFRTPRHIIDFIVEIVDPKKNEKILDPSCGTAGFLISSYKNILKSNTKKNLGDQLNPSDRKNINENLSGFDISPEFLKVSLMNMFLHKFNNPNIIEYDTLSDDSKWNQYYDVILANPPFFTPKGGITPHNRFGVKSKKAEVLFVDYINEHLLPNGRGGIIVPGGIVYRAGSAYRQVRKKIINESLVGVISLPAGVFNPYSNVKTSILILDKKINKQIKDIFFVEVSNDGFDLGKTRKPIKENDLPIVLASIKNYLNNGVTNKFLNLVSKKDILNSNDIGLVYSRYTKEKLTSEYEYFLIDDICDVINGSTPLRKNKSYWVNGTIPWFTIDDLREQGHYINKTRQMITVNALKETTIKMVPKNSVLICCTTSVGECAFSEIEITTNQQFNSLVIKQKFKDKLLPKFLFWMCTLIKKELLRNSGKTSFNFISGKKLKELSIPIPKVKKQKEILKKIEKELNNINHYKTVINESNKNINDSINKVWGFQN
jgi:type I restriction enzyme M protein